DFVERLAGEYIKVPGLGVHRRRRTDRHRDDFLEHFARHRLLFVAPDAAAPHHNVFELQSKPLHCLCSRETAWRIIATRLLWATGEYWDGIWQREIRCNEIDEGGAAMIDYHGTTALVTGGASGIGKALAAT